MAREYFCAYHSLIESLTPYGDAECGRLFRAALVYSATGNEEEFRGNERYIWPTIKLMIDRDKAAYDAKCEQNRANASGGRRPQSGGSSRKRSPANASGGGKEKEEDKEEGEDKDNTSSDDDVIPAHARDPALGKVIDAYEQNIGRFPNGIIVESMKQYLSQLNTDVILLAIDKAVANGVFRWDYVAGILDNYLHAGVTTVAAAQVYDANYRQQKAASRKRAMPVNASSDPVMDELRTLHSMFSEEDQL